LFVEMLAGRVVELVAELVVEHWSLVELWSVSLMERGQ
jgi:hypothetical protein